MKFNKPKFWDIKKPNLVALLLIPLTLPILLNNLLRKFKKRKKYPDIFSICIGNIYVGGTGKTPLAIKSNNILNAEKLNSVIIKKFYKNQLDEQLLIKKYSNLICKEKRLDAIKEANLKKFKYAIFDDGLQDKSLDYNLKIVCFNNLQWIGNGLIIPAGPLREKVDSIKEYDAVVINGDPKLNVNLIAELKRIKNNLQIFETNYEISNLNDFDRKLNYVIFSAIGNPKNFLKLLKENNFNILKEFIFPDHYIYSDKDIESIINYSKSNNLKIITTEKDYLKINEKFLNEINILKLDIKILNEKKFKNFLTEKQ